MGLKHGVLMAALTLLFACGCGSVVYEENDKTYKTVQEAKLAEAETQRDVLARIDTRQSPLAGKAIVVVPTFPAVSENYDTKVKDELVDHVVPWFPFGKANIPLQSWLASEYGTYYDFRMQSYLENAKLAAEIIKKRGVFEDISIVESSNPEENAIGDNDYKFYLALNGPYRQAIWTLRRYDCNIAERIFFDDSRRQASERYIYWLHELETVVAKWENKAPPPRLDVRETAATSATKEQSSTPELSGKKTLIAVWPLTAMTGISKDLMNPLSESVRTAMIKTGHYTAVARSDMEKVLKERDISLSTTCDSTDSAVEFGRILSVDSIVVGSVSKIGNTYQVVIKVIDVKSGKIAQIGKARKPGAQEVLFELADEAVKDL